MDVKTTLCVYWVLTRKVEVAVEKFNKNRKDYATSTWKMNE